MVKRRGLRSPGGQVSRVAREMDRSLCKVLRPLMADGVNWWMGADN